MMSGSRNASLRVRVCWMLGLCSIPPASHRAAAARHAPRCTSVLVECSLGRYSSRRTAITPPDPGHNWKISEVSVTDSLGRSNGDLFAGTAWHYARYRPGYPQAFFDDLARQFRL